MNSITLKQMRYVVALARLGHFGHAADACAISQPALSMQIKELERTLGTPVFERGPRKVSLTRFGEEVVARMRDVLRSVDELGELAQRAQQGFAGPLRIGVIPTVAPYLLPGIIAQLTQDHAALDLHIRETVTSRLIAEIKDGQLDTAIVALPVSEPSLAELPLFSEAFLLVRSLADAGRPVPSPESLTEMRLLLLEEGHCFRDQALSFCGLAAKPPREILDGSSLSTLVQMVSAGIGVTLIPEMAVPLETRSADVAIDRFTGPEPRRTIGMVWRRTNPLASHLQAVAEIVRRAASTTSA